MFILSLLILTYIGDVSLVVSVILVSLSTTLELRKLMKVASEEGMASPDFAFIYVTFSAGKDMSEPWGPTDGLSQGQINQLKKPFVGVKMVVNFLWINFFFLDINFDHLLVYTCVFFFWIIFFGDKF